MNTIFFRLLDGVNRPSRLSDSVEELRENGPDPSTSKRPSPTSPSMVGVGKAANSLCSGLAARERSFCSIPLTAFPNTIAMRLPLPPAPAARNKTLEDGAPRAPVREVAHGDSAVTG